MSTDMPINTISGRSVRLSRVTSSRLVAEPSRVAVVISPIVRPLNPRDNSSGAKLADMTPSPTARRPRVARIERVPGGELSVTRKSDRWPAERRRRSGGPPSGPPQQR